MLSRGEHVLRNITSGSSLTDNESELIDYFLIQFRYNILTYDWKDKNCRTLINNGEDIKELWLKTKIPQALECSHPGIRRINIRCNNIPGVYHHPCCFGFSRVLKYF